MIKMPNGEIYFGDERSLNVILDAIAMQQNGGSIAKFDLSMGRDDDDEDSDKPYLYERHGSVGIITIKGSLTNQSSPFNRFFGLTAYSDIRNALVAAINDGEAKKILLDIDSGGGAALGMLEVAQFINQIDKRIKPVEAYTGGSMASAAYWLGMQARKITVSNMAEVGSIGVITVHKEFSEAFNQQGVGVSVIRVGRFKALGNPFEKLSDLARKEIETKMEDFYGMFLAATAQARSRSVEDVQKNMAEGRVFIGSKAVEIGLADAQGFFDEVVAKLQDRSNTTTARGVPTSATGQRLDTNEDPMKKRTLLSEQAAALLANGADPAAAAAPAAPALDADPAAAAAPEAAADPAAPAAEPAAPTTSAAAEPAAPEAPAAEPTTAELQAQLVTMRAERDANVGLVSQLNTRVSDLSTQIATLTAADAASKTKIEGFEALVPKLESAVREATKRLSIAIGGTGAGLDSLSGLALLEAYTGANTQFTSRFQVGGKAVAAKPDDEQSSGEGREATALHTATVRAVGFKKK